MKDLQERLARLSPEKRALLALRLSKGAATEAETQSAPAVELDRANRHEPFPLTDLQQAYWIGRSGAFEIGNVASHSYIELENDFDIERLSAAWRRLIDRHSMLRAVVRSDGRQQVLPEVAPYRIEVDDLRAVGEKGAQARLGELRHRMSHNVLPSDRWPLFEIRAARLDAGCVRLLISLDALMIDGWSLFLLFNEWAELYHHPDRELEPLELSFRDYVLAERKLQGSEAFNRAREYWRRRVGTLPPGPDLPLAQNPASMTSVRFERRNGRIEPKTWARLKSRAGRAGMTPTGVMCAAYAEVLALWSKSPHFTLSVPRFNRRPLHSQVNSVIGESASFSLLEVDASARGTFEDRARRLQQQLWEDLDHADYNGVKVLRDLAQSRAASAGVRIPVIFTVAAQDPEGNDAYITSAARKLGQPVFAINQTSQVWMDNHVNEQQGALVCDWDSVVGLFPEGVSETMFRAFFGYLERLASDEGCWRQGRAEIAQALMPPEQLARRSVLHTTEPALGDGRLHDPFLAQLPRHRDKTAVVTPKRILTYGQLDELSNRWGRRLRELGAWPNRLVAVVMEKGWEQPVAALSILKSGAAYVPMDTEVPEERLNYLLQHSEVELVLTQSWVHDSRRWPEGVRCMCIDREGLEDVDPAALGPAQGPDDIANVIYTSGSTGLPKGAILTHRGALNAIVCTHRRFHIGPDDGVLAVTALHHDMSMFDLFGVLGAGGTLVIPEPSGLRDPAHWSELMLANRVTVWNSVPAMMEMLLEHADEHPGALPDSLRVAFLGGDWINVTLPERLGRHVAGAQVVSVGGPTETTLWNIWYPVERVDPSWNSIPYGKPIAHTRYHVVNELFEDCPDWVPGEMWVSGVGVARGYWNDAEKTKAKFIHHPRTGERIYRTGDIGRHLPDGDIEFLGRVDFQVKIQGQRIELGEIEAALQQHEAVRGAVVMAIGDLRGRKRLVGYVVAKRAAEPPTADELRRHLGAKLPPHMLPSAFVTLDSFPLTANGKVDRKALPDPEEAAETTAAASIGGSTAATIERIVSEILSVGPPDPDANLLTLGANSIDMVRIGNQLEKEFGHRPRMDQIFRLQTINAMAAYFDEYLTDREPPPEAVATGNAPAELSALLASTRVLIDLAERDAFKNRRPGVRRGDKNKTSIRLARPALDDSLRERYDERRSYRAFTLKPIPFEQMSRFLGCLSEIALDDNPHKFLYASPGGLNPTQVYLHIKPGRIEGLSGGAYYYHPEDHRLVCLTPDVDIDRDIHIPFINTPIFDQSAFSVFLIAEMRAIVPSYGDKSLLFVTLEAGVMSHLLECAGPPCGIGLCQIGSIEFERIRRLFDVGDSHLLIHSLLGGGMDRSARIRGYGPTRETDASKTADLLRRVRELSDEEARALLEAQSKKDDE